MGVILQVLLLPRLPSLMFVPLCCRCSRAVYADESTSELPPLPAVAERWGCWWEVGLLVGGGAVGGRWGCWWEVLWRPVTALCFIISFSGSAFATEPALQ